MPAAFSTAKASLTLLLPPAPPSQAVSRSTQLSRCQTSSPIPKLQVSMRSMGFSPATIWIIRSMYNVKIHNIMKYKLHSTTYTNLHVSISIYNSRWSLHFIDRHDTEDKTVVFEVLAVVGHTQAKCRVREEHGTAPSTSSLSIYLSSFGSCIFVVI